MNTNGLNGELRPLQNSDLPGNESRLLKNFAKGSQINLFVSIGVHSWFVFIDGRLFSSE